MIPTTFSSRQPMKDDSGPPQESGPPSSPGYRTALEAEITRGSLAAEVLRILADRRRCGLSTDLSAAKACLVQAARAARRRSLGVPEVTGEKP